MTIESRRVAVRAADQARAEVWASLLADAGFHVSTDRDLPPEELALVVVDSEPAPPADVPVIAIVPPDGLDAALARIGPDLADVVVQTHATNALVASVRRVLETRRLEEVVRLEEITRPLLAMRDLGALAREIAEIARVSCGADAAVLVMPGSGGQLAAEHRSDVPGAPLPLPEALLRRSERLMRTGTTAGSRDDTHGIPAVLGPPEHCHGVLWVLRGPGRSAFHVENHRTIEILRERATAALDRLHLLRDLEERLAAMEETRRRLEVEARAGQVGRLAIAAAHQLSAPLAYTRTNLRHLAGELRELGEPAATHLRYALDGLARVEHAVEDLKRVGQARDRVEIEVRQLIDAALAHAGALNAAFAVEVAENTRIQGNLARLSHAVAELVRNADDAGATRIDLRASRLGERVTLEVADDGSGIPAGVLPRVQEAYFSTRGRTGLGLTTCAETVAQSGGELEIRSRPGVGTVVRVFLPGETIDDFFELAEEGEE